MPECHCGHHRRIGAQDARAQRHWPPLWQSLQAGALGFRKATLWAGEDGPGLPGSTTFQRGCRPRERLVTKHQLPISGPDVQNCREFLQSRNLGHEGAAALLGSLHRMGLQPVLPDTLGIGEIGLDRADARSPHLGGFLHDEIGARLLDRRKKHPEIGRHLQWACLRLGHQHSAAFVRLDHCGSPFPCHTVEKRHSIPFSQAHDTEKIMRLRTVEGNGLPLPQRVLYIQPDLCILHEGQHMSSDHQTPEAGGQVADAYRGNWVDHHAPAWSRPYLRLSRADRPIGTWLLLLPCWWGLALAMLASGRASWFDAWILVGCAIGAFLMRGAGCTWNDITDRHIDGRVARTASRPIPSGQVSVPCALGWLVLQALLALGILLTFNTAAIILGVLALLPVCIYPFAKRFTWWPQVFLGLAFNWGALLAWTAHSGSLGLPAVLLYLAGIAWTLFYDTIYAHQDAEDDALIGVKSTALLFGARTAVWLRRFLVLSVLLMAAAVILAATEDHPFAVLVALLGPWAMGAHMVWQMTRFDMDDGPGLLRLFRSNRDAGLAPLPFFAVALLL